MKRSLGKGSLDGQQAHTDGTVHVLYMSIVDTIKNVPLCKSRVEFVTAFSPFAFFFVFINHTLEFRYVDPEVMSTPSILTWRGGQP